MVKNILGMVAGGYTDPGLWAPIPNWLPTMSLPRLNMPARRLTKRKSFRRAHRLAILFD